MDPAVRSRLESARGTRCRRIVFAVFSVRLTARPDARMVEVPLEIEAELPREFDGAALLVSSGLPRKVKIKAARDALRLSTAYRADQLVGDIVRTALRGNAQDVERVQEAVTRFVRTVRERRQEGATLLVSGNGQGKIEVAEQAPSPPRAAASASLERRVADLEALGDRITQLEQRVAALTAQLTRASEVARPGVEKPPRGGARRQTAVDAYAEGLRSELRARAAAAAARAQTERERSDKAATLAVEAELLGAPRDGTSERLRQASAEVAARESALRRLTEEIEFYAASDLPVADQLLGRMEKATAPDPGPSLEAVAQAVRAGADAAAKGEWLRRAAALCGWPAEAAHAAEGDVALAVAGSKAAGDEIVDDDAIDDRSPPDGTM